MFKIQDRDDLEFLKQQYKENKIVFIKDILSDEDAKRISCTLKSIPSENWNVSIHPYNPNQYIFQNTKQNKNIIDEGVKSALKHYEKGEFSYYFYRCDNYSPDDSDNLGKFRLFLTSEDFSEWIRKLTGLEIKNAISIFASKYSPNCFLTTHSDTGRGKIAFVFNFTQIEDKEKGEKWKEEFGGNFQILDWDYSTIKRTIIPTFNSLVVFNVEGQGIPHRVTKVSPEVNVSRYAVGGWFN